MACERVKPTYIICLLLFINCSSVQAGCQQKFKLSSLLKIVLLFVYILVESDMYLTDNLHTFTPYCSFINFCAYAIFFLQLNGIFLVHVKTGTNREIMLNLHTHTFRGYYFIGYQRDSAVT